MTTVQVPDVRLLTAEQVAELLQVTVGWIYRQARSGKLPSLKVGRCRRFRVSDIDKFLSGDEVDSSRGASAA